MKRFIFVSNHEWKWRCGFIVKVKRRSRPATSRPPPPQRQSELPEAVRSSEVVGRRNMPAVRPRFVLATVQLALAVRSARIQPARPPTSLFVGVIVAVFFLFRPFLFAVGVNLTCYPTPANRSRGWRTSGDESTSCKKIFPWSFRSHPRFPGVVVLWKKVPSPTLLYSPGLVRYRSDTSSGAQSPSWPYWPTKTLGRDFKVLPPTV